MLIVRNRTAGPWVRFALICATVNLASAAEASAASATGGLGQCAQISDPASRLICFDALAAAAPSPPVQAERPASPPPSAPALPAPAPAPAPAEERQPLAEERRAGATRFVPPIARRNRDEDKEPRQEAVAVIRSASINNDGQATLVLDDGSVWKQFGERSLRKAPTPGAEATFRKAMFGSYFVKLEGEPAIRVSRIR